MNLDLAFQVENGLVIDDEVAIAYGGNNPAIAGEDAPVGSLYLRTTGELFQKNGPANTDWAIFTQGFDQLLRISATDTTSTYLGTKLVTTSHLTTTVLNAGANESLQLDLSNIGSPGTYNSVTVDSKGRVTAGSNPTTLAGYGILDAQPLDADLTSIAALSTVGYLTRTGPNTWATRTFQGTTNQITLTNGSGGTGNTTLSFPTTNLTFPGTQGVILPRGTTAQRVNTAATLRYNNDNNTLEYFNASTWVPLVASTGGTVTSVASAQPAAGLTISGSPITTAGTLTFALANDLAAVEGLVGTGIAVRSATDTWTTRSLLGTTDRVTITNGDGTAGDPAIDIASTYAGQTSITTLGTVSAGTWNATTIATNRGGTGRTTIGAANEVLAVNTTATGLEYKVVVGGTGLGVNITAGQIALSNTGVTSAIGTANQVNVSNATGVVTFSLPQSIGTASTPTFGQITLAGDPTTPLQVATKQYVDNAVQGIDHKASVRAATTVGITLSGTQTIDGVAVDAGDRVLVKNQSAPAQNGIYVVAAGAWARASDMDVWSEVPGSYTFVEEGATQADTAWVSTADQGGTLDTTAITWVQFSSASDIIAGTGLTRTGNTIFITNTAVTPGSGYNQFTVNAQGQITSAATVGYLTGNQTITLTGDATGSGTVSIPVTLATVATPGTYRSVTVNAKGLVTAGSNPTTLAGYGITDAQPLDGDLTAIAALTGTGLPVRVGTNSWAQRSIVAGSSKISVVNGDGVSGNPTVDAVEANFTLNNIGGTLGTAKGGTNLTTLGTANQVLGVNAAGTGYEHKSIVGGSGITINHSANQVQIVGNTGTVTSVAVSGSTGLTVGGSPITASGTITLTLGTELQGLSALSANGLITRTAVGTYASRSVVSGNGTITITNPLGTAGNIGLDLTTVGTAGTYRSVTTDIYGRVTAGTNPTTLAGYGITDAIPTSEKGAVNGVATLDSAGLIPTSQLPPLAVNSTTVVADQVSMLALTAQIGDMAVRTDVNRTFVLAAEPASALGNWIQLADGPSGTVTSVAAVQPAAGLTITGGPITSSGTLTFALANDLAGLENLATNGIAVRTGTSTWATRTLVAGTGISLTNADGVAGNISINATNNGTVTSVGLTVPSFLSVAGSPITSSGTFAVTLANQSAGTFFAGPVSGGAAAPTFRTIALDEMSDVVITSPSTNQVIAYNGTNWVNTGAVGANAAGLIGAGQSGAAAWVLVSGSTYRADFAHNLGTTNVVITVFNSATNGVVIPNSITLTDNNTVRVTVTGNSLTLKVVVVANGQSIVAGGSTPSSVITAKDGVTVSTAATRLNFTGQAVGVVDAGGGTTNVTIGSRFTYFANSLDNPVNSDFAINALAPVVTDPSFASLNVRQFSNTVEQGVGFMVTVPQGATQVTIKIRGRAQTAPGTASVVQPRIYTRLIPNNATMPGWSGANELPNISIPTNANFQYYTATFPLAAGGFTAGNTYNVELTRRVSGVTGTNLASNFLMVSLELEFF